MSLEIRHCPRHQYARDRIVHTTHTLKVARTGTMYDLWIVSDEKAHGDRPDQLWHPWILIWGPKEVFTKDNRKELYKNSKNDSWLVGFKFKPPEIPDYYDDKVPTAIIEETVTDLQLHDDVRAASRNEYPIEALFDRLGEFFSEYLPFFHLFFSEETIDVPPSRRKRKRKGRTA